MYNPTRRGRGGVAAARTEDIRPALVGPDITSYSVGDRVSDLGLTATNITSQTEQRIAWLLDEILIRHQFRENPFELAAYVCALEKEKDSRLLTLVLNLSFQMIKVNQNAALNCPRLFEIIARETLPSMEDGSTTDSQGRPLKGIDLFLKYMNDQLRRHLEDAWEEKESAMKAFSGTPNNLDAETAASRAVDHWINMISLANSLRRQYLTSELQLHEIITKQFSAYKPTAREISILALLIMPTGLDAKTYKMKDRLDEHYSKLRILARREDLDQEAQRSLAEMVQALGSTDMEARSQLPINPAHNANLKPADRHKPLAASVEVLPANPRHIQATTSSIRNHSRIGSTIIQAETPQSPFGSALSGQAEFQVTSATPISQILEFFTQASETPVQDYTSELREAECSDTTVASSALSDIWFATLRQGARVAIKCVRTAISGSDKVIKHTVKELNVWSKLNHANILPLLGVALFKGQLAMVSEWMEHGSIVTIVNSRPELDRFDLCGQVVGVVVWLHNKQLIHGDLKGANILMTKDDVPKLTDFGLSIMHQEVLRFSTTYQGGGTTRWMAPELFGDNPTRSYETDVYALGMVRLSILQEIFTGQEPFREILNGHQISTAVTRDRITPNRPECLTVKNPQHELFWNAMQRCWVHNPKQRATAEEVEQILNSLPEQSGLNKSLRNGASCCTMA